MEVLFRDLENDAQLSSPFDRSADQVRLTAAPLPFSIAVLIKTSDMYFWILPIASFMPSPL
jgi:hypothetical protein